MEIQAPAAVTAFLALPLIVVLYLLKVKGRDVPVSRLFLWPVHLADRQADTPWKRPRRSWLLLAQLLVAAAVAVALMRPGLVGAGGVARTTVVLIDTSPSMQATDVAPSRFRVAVNRARDLAGQLGEGQEMAVVALGDHAQLLAPPTSDVSTLRAALSRVRPSGVAAGLEEGIAVANAVLAGRGEGSVVLLSDGYLQRTEAPPRLSAPLTYESIGKSGSNVALETMGRTPEGDVFLRVANSGATAQNREIELRADGRLVDALDVRAEAGSSTEAVWPRLPAGTEVLEARLTPADDLGLDDTAWLVVAVSPPRKVVLVTEGNGFLAHALSLLADVDLTVVTPAEYAPGTADLSVFDGFVPDGALPSPALVIDPPPGKGPVVAGGPIDPGPLLPPAPRDPLLQHVSLGDVHVQSAASVKPPPGWRTVVEAANGPLLVVSQGEPRLAQLNFDLHDSDLPLRAAFPILVQNLVSHLTPGPLDQRVVALGQPVRLPAGPDARSVTVTTPDRRTADLAPPYPATFNDTTAPGVYTVEETGPGGTTTSRFVVQLQDPEQSRIAPGEQPLVRTTAAAPGDAPRGTKELWPWVAALVLLGLAVEWVVFLRG